MSKISWPRLVAEALAILLGVLLALGLNEWRQSLSERQLASRAIETLRAEIEFNRAAMAESIPHHKQVFTDLRNPELTTGVSLRPALLRNSAWETALATGAVAHLDFELVNSATMLHVMHQEHQRLVYTALDIIYALNVAEPPSDFQAVRRGYSYLLGDLVATQEQLLLGYEEVLRLLGN